MDIILAIHHKYAQEIINGTKRYEYRKMTFKHVVSNVYLYESSPVKRVTAVFHCLGVFHVKPKVAWSITHSVAGISKHDYFKYYDNSKLATLLSVGHVHVFKHPHKLHDFGINKAPMSFQYMKH